MVTISSDQLSVRIKPAGAEVCSIKNAEGLEYIWQADKDVWPRHAPVLFPVVGKLKNDCFEYGGQKFQLGQHGFARDEPFEISSSEKSAVTFRLNDNSETQKKYPGAFLLEIEYTLAGNALMTKYNISNPGDVDLLFSIGAHPGFRCPLQKGEKFGDYFLEFGDSQYEISLLEGGLRSGKKEPLMLRDKKLPLSPNLFDRDALVFENRQISHILLRSGKSDRAVEMICEGWPYFGIWSKKGCDEFVCLEPWYGIADHIGASGKLEDKEGILKLAPSGTFTCSFVTRFY